MTHTFDAFRLVCVTCVKGLMLYAKQKISHLINLGVAPFYISYRIFIIAFFIQIYPFFNCKELYPLLLYQFLPSYQTFVVLSNSCRVGVSDFFPRDLH